MIQIHGDVTADGCMHAGFEIYRATERNKPVSLAIDSDGGHWEPAERLGRTLSESDAIAYVRNAGSAAAHLACCCRTIVAAPESRFFVHDATMLDGTETDSSRSASRYIAVCVQRKCGVDFAIVRSLMQRETALTGEEAHQLGLVDLLVSTEDMPR